MRRLSLLPLLPALAVLVLALMTSLPLHAASQTVELTNGRWYRIDLPTKPEGASVILALHGGGGNPNQFARNSGLSPPATERGYAVIYPAGSGRTRLLTWNAGYCCAYAQVTGVDDMGFLDAVLADAAERFGVDDDRVFATGMSNGSMMAERYAAGRPAKVRAVAGVAGTMDPSFRVEAPVALLHIHGTADRMVPFTGGKGEKSFAQVPFAAVSDTAAAFASAWHGPLVQTQGKAVGTDGTSIVTREWRLPDGRVAVKVMVLEGFDHAWPGGRRAGPLTGFDADTAILDFFDAAP
ncbi:hypothetical protein L0V05_13380 [Tabrizicola sp. J26]|uniref:alpha/beta hydrolase family esterase n=1 Tax=Alitabrizicola rongguiensis TaxID=2909234 RepID=UPI001F420142|nr:PHB depolymerase family esterase [Tabrizicola rongguiensis]MCF1709805.1 hypothetical protein [Tabrizicola rongguiensis]